MTGGPRRVTGGPLTGRTLVVGPSNVGKTKTTAEALERWLATNGPAGVCVLDFAPELERDGRTLGGRLERFTTVPDDAFQGVLDAHAPRADGDSDEAALALARDNAERAQELLDGAPDRPTAVFLNDATIPFQDSGDTGRLRSYCADAELVVANAFESDELGAENPVSRNERAAIAELRVWADRVLEL